MRETLMSNVVRYELQKSAFYPEVSRPEEMELRRLSSSAVRFAAFLWHNLGAEARDWTDARWFERLADICVENYVVYCAGEPVGGFELERTGELVTITGFGVLETYRGAGFSKAMLTAALEKSFAMGAETISLELPEGLPEQTSAAALPVLKSQGFRVVVDDTALLDDVS
jgi:GNAT superfamily N-acetyltransferase